MAHPLRRDPDRLFAADRGLFAACWTVSDDHSARLETMVAKAMKNAALPVI